MRLSAGMSSLCAVGFGQIAKKGGVFLIDGCCSRGDTSNCALVLAVLLEERETEQTARLRRCADGGSTPLRRRRRNPGSSWSPQYASHADRRLPSDGSYGVYLSAANKPMPTSNSATKFGARITAGRGLHLGRRPEKEK
jgi:hypothetical protein